MNYGYELVDPRDKLPFYVGITKQKPEVRLQQHLSLGSTNRIKNERIQEIHNAGLEIIQNVLFEEEDRAAAHLLEQGKISEYLAAGIQLTNIQHVPSALKKADDSGIEFIVSTSKRRTEQKDYDGAYYPIELLAHPDYLNDRLDDAIDEETEIKGSLLAQEETLMTLEFLMLGCYHTYKWDREAAYLDKWYKSLFELGGRFEGVQPGLKVA